MAHWLHAINTVSQYLSVLCNKVLLLWRYQRLWLRGCAVPKCCVLIVCKFMDECAGVTKWISATEVLTGSVCKLKFSVVNVGYDDVTYVENRHCVSEIVCISASIHPNADLQIWSILTIQCHFYLFHFYFQYQYNTESTIKNVTEYHCFNYRKRLQKDITLLQFLLKRPNTYTQYWKFQKKKTMYVLHMFYSPDSSLFMYVWVNIDPVLTAVFQVCSRVWKWRR